MSLCILNIYFIYYYDVFGRECYTEVEAMDESDAIETVQDDFSDGLYIPEIISVEKVDL